MELTLSIGIFIGIVSILFFVFGLFLGLSFGFRVGKEQIK
jgi:hypothetical protein